MILAIDPGNEQSAYVHYLPQMTLGQAEQVLDFGKVPNAELERIVAATDADTLVIEMIASYGMPVGREVFETCVAIGRFQSCYELGEGPWRQSHAIVYRRDVKLHLCGQARAKDGNIRQALIDRFGGKEKAIGKKATPGPLYGVTADVWAALAIAVTYSDQNAHTRTRGALDARVPLRSVSSEPLTERSRFVRESDEVGRTFGTETAGGR